MGVVVLADGMGGLNAGEVASAEAVAAVMEHVRARADELVTDPAAELAAAVHRANRAVHELASKHAAYKGMGTTIVVAALVEDRLLTAHVGDSRAYHYDKSGVLSCMTTDHSLVARLVATGVLSAEQARRAPNRNIVTRALGVGRDIECDINSVDLLPGERALICSDGLTDMLDDAQIAQVCALSESLESTVENLLGAALAAGGLDNISVVAIER